MAKAEPEQGIVEELEYEEFDEGICSFDTISNCYSMPTLHAIGKNDKFLIGSEASMFLEFHTSSYQQFNTWNDVDDISEYMAYVPKAQVTARKPRYKKKSSNIKGKNITIKGLMAKKNGQKNGTKTDATQEVKQMDQSNNSSTIGSLSAKEFQSIDSNNSVLFLDAQSAGSSTYERRPVVDQTYKILFEAQVKKVNKLENELHLQNETILHLKRAQDHELGENRQLSMRVIKLQKNLENLTQNLGVSDPTPRELEIIKEKDKKIQELAAKLAQEMSQKIALDEGNLENVGIQNRPMNVATEYELLCSNQWLHAKNTLDARCPNISEGIKVDFLSMVFKIGEEQATRYLQHFKYRVKDELDNPLHGPKYQSASNPRPVESWLPLPDNVNISIADYLRGNADDVDLSQLIQSTKEALRSRKPDEISTAYTFNLTFTKFLESSARICWKMALQRPPLKFKTDGLYKEWNGLFDLQELYWGSTIPQDRAAVIRYYVHPMLYHGDKLMVKGRVLVN